MIYIRTVYTEVAKRFLKTREQTQEYCNAVFNSSVSKYASIDYSYFGNKVLVHHKRYFRK